MSFITSMRPILTAFVSSADQGTRGVLMQNSSRV